MKLYSLFSALARITTPHGHEAYCWSFIPYINYIDEKQNVWCWVKNKDGSYPSVMFSCHCDTAGGGKPAVTGVNIKKGIVRSAGDTVLGADDKAGMAIMIKMIEKEVPGLYIFHAGEECGGIGSGYLSKEWARYLAENDPKNKLTQALKGITQCVAFDRRNTGSIITHQGGTRTCSDEYGLALATAFGLNHKLDQTGTFTDTKNYAKIFSECTNISVGFDNEHSRTESLDWGYFGQLCDAAVKVDWQALPTKRDKTKEESRWGGGYYSGNYSAVSDGKKSPITEKFDKKNERWQKRWTRTGDGNFKMDDTPIPVGAWVMTFDMAQTGYNDFAVVLAAPEKGKYLIQPYDNHTGKPVGAACRVLDTAVYHCKEEIEKPIFPINWLTQFETRTPRTTETAPPKAVPRQKRGEAQNLLKTTRVLTVPVSPTAMNYCQSCNNLLTKEGKLLRCCSRCGVELSQAQQDALSLS